MSKSSPLTIQSLSVRYGARVALSEVNLTIESPGKIIGILGPNGAGKSTLMKACLNLVEKDKGDVHFFGNSYLKSISSIAYIPQRQSVDWNFPVSAYEVVEMGLGFASWKSMFKSVNSTQVDAALQTVGMFESRFKQIGELSGGQQQRLFVARALAQNAEIYLFDEPFQGIDVRTQHDLLDVFKSLARNGKTLLVVHHDIKSALAKFDECVLLNKRVVAHKRSELISKEDLSSLFETNESLFCQAVQVNSEELGGFD